MTSRNKSVGIYRAGSYILAAGSNMTVDAEYVEAVRCPCGAFIYVSESVDEATCGNCKRRIRWNPEQVRTPSTNVALQGAASPATRLPIRFPFWTIYKVGFWITAVIAFFCCWVYTVVASGFIIGVLIGWLPSAIAAAVIGALWPMLLGGVLVVAYFFTR